MDSETIKKLILTKLFDELVPKLFNYWNILGISRSSWSPDIRQFGETSYRDIEINISVRENGDFINCHFQKKTEDPNARRPRPFRREAIAVYVPEILLDVNFNKKETAIKEICKNVDVRYITLCGMAAISEIEIHDDIDKMSIGAIKKILGINMNVDLENLETRKVLLEIIKQ